MWNRKRLAWATEIDIPVRLVIAAPAVMALLFATGCGGQSFANKYKMSSISSDGGSYSGSSSSGGGSQNDGSTNGSGSTSGGTGVPPLSFRVGAYGYTSTSVSVATGRVLRLKFAAGQQDQTMQGNGYSPNYSGLGVFITVGNLTQPTPLVHNGAFGTNAESTTVMEFSSGITSQCASSSDPSCRANVTITVAQPNFDYYCISFGYGCPWAHVGDGMPWHGTLTVQTDDTDALN